MTGLVISEQQARELAHSTLSEERFYHTECVAKAAKELAKRYGADVEAAAVAGYLHDIAKERDKADLLQTIERGCIIDLNLIRDSEALWHAFAGAVYARELGLPQEISDAVAYHTTGCAGMTLLDKIVFIADYISEDREFRGVDEVREFAKTSLDDACRVSLRNCIIHVTKMGKHLNVISVNAYNYLVDSGRI